MAQEVTLSAAIRTNLLALSDSTSLIDRTQSRLSTGLKVASPIDDATAFFESKSLSDRAIDLEDRKSGIDQAISSVSTALEAIEAVDSVLRQLKGLAIQAKSATGSQLTSIVSQFNELRTQISNLANDAEFQGLNLVNSSGNSLTVEFSTSTTSTLTIDGVDITLNTGGTGLTVAAAANFSLTSNIDSALAQIDADITTLRGNASTLGSNVALLQTRLDFTERYVNVLEEGAGKLTLADLNEEGANLVALQTRQQLGIQALAFAGQSEQSVLALFR
ncbi:MAG: flagellin [Kiloniellales bacterium]|nr:flagellin [Kiloniellales bacterium]MDJ0982753.1 flagellin [Kiloniellales bacterium]